MGKEITRLKEKDILIVGFGREGQSTYKFLRKHYPSKPIAIADQKQVQLEDPNVDIHSGDEYLAKIQEYDLIFKSPGVPDKLPPIQEARANGIEFTSQTKLFFAVCEGQIIGVTGTKGKSTTTSLIHHVLSSAHHPAVLIGNIGSPCLDYLDESLGRDKIFCFELSSYQLSDLSQSPHIAVFLNIFREHLDHHGSQEEYLKAKANITKYQERSDYFIYNADQEELQKVAENSPATALGFSIKGQDHAAAYLEKDQIVYQANETREVIISTDKIPLLGEHNLNNVMAAILVAKAFGVSTKSIEESIASFLPLKHRLQPVGEHKGILFYDDALATIPEATIAAINALDGKVGTLILGGTDRGQDFKDLARVIVDQEIGAVALFPDTGEKIWEEIKKLSPQNPPRHIHASNMEEAVKFCYENTAEGKACLMSTASPSFTLFKDYEDKAVQFKKYIELLHTRNFSGTV